MSNLSVEELTLIAVSAARAASPNLHVIGVTLGAGGGEYAEVILNIEGCRKEPCRVSLGVLRNLPEPALHAEIAMKLREHLRRHQS